MAIKTIQNGAHQYTNQDVTKYSLMMGGLNVTHEVLQQYDPLITGYGRLFMVRTPQVLERLFSNTKGANKFKNFKHILEYGNTAVSGLGDVSVDFEQITGGYTGKSFEIPKVAKDETSSFQVKVYEFSGSPMREMLHTWINTTTDLQSGLTHYGGLIASGEMEYNQANHTAEFIYVVTDRTGMKVEYACLLANCFPKGYKNDQFNYSAGEHNFVEMDIEFTCTKYESVDINEKASQLLKNYQILVNSIEFNSGLDSSSDGNLSVFKRQDVVKTGYNPKNGKLEEQDRIDYFVNPSTSSTARNKPFNEDVEKTTPSYTVVGGSNKDPITK